MSPPDCATCGEMMEDVNALDEGFIKPYYWCYKCKSDEVAPHKEVNLDDWD